MKPKKDKRSNLQKEYDNAVLLLKTVMPDTDEYQSQLKSVERLHKLLMDEEEHKNRLSMDALVSGIVNLTGIGMILGYEHLGRVTSKALGFVLKGRLR